MTESVTPEKPAHRQISWPEGLDESVFLRDYWQQKPLLLRGAFPGFQTPLTPDELAGLSVESDSTARLITCDDDGIYQLESGPIPEERFSRLTGNRWSLLVTDVEKLLPELRAWMEPFGFLPQWRVDDLMISYAPDGASVGAHVDEYDVFLLQASGTRTWAIDSSGQQLDAPVKPGVLRILKDFNPTDVWDLAAGDMLYLPAGFAHHGIAKGENCTTWSIGFRAPLFSDMIYRVADQITQLYNQRRFRDGPLDIANAGEISHQVIRQFQKIWTDAVQLDDAQFTQLIGQWLTETDNLPEVAEGAVVHTGKTEFSVAPFSRLGWIEKSETNDSGTVWLFADGARHDCPRELAVRLCNSVYSPLPYGTIARSDMALIDALVCAGSISQTERQSDPPSDA